MRSPGAVFRASHVLVFLLIIGVLGFGLLAAMAAFAAPGSGVVVPFVNGLRL
jgi:hypothetical protein